MALLNLENTKLSFSSLPFILSSKPFSHRGKNDCRLFIGEGDQMFVRVSFLPSRFPSGHELLMKTLLSELRTIFSSLLVVPGFLHGVLVPVKIQIERTFQQ